ncbi:pentatricopeptide repeat-containing protein At3g02330, mitochondrial-like [Musa acuminata AAA Group]|uniref:pentatricopeptide repeat-containing protein At3g02330, mitochondrial-like n=1 Tax=Musa acuminata AAA Group TaxID=214697 RepID=UPI0031D6E0D7
MTFVTFHPHLLSKRSSLSPRSLLKCLAYVASFSTTPLGPRPLAKMTFYHVFQQCSKHHDGDTGGQAHARMLVSGFVPTTFVANCLIHMYITCSNLDYAHQVFVRMPQRDTVSWNAMIAGYARNGSVHVAKSLFDRMPERDVISWNSLMSGCLQNGGLYEPINLFIQMLWNGIDPDRTTFAVILKSCAALEELNMGIQIHGAVIKMGLHFDVVTGSALVDMYAKCKSLDESICLFSEMPERNWVSWSAVIAGCVQNEHYATGFEMFIEMQRAGVGQSQSAYASVFRSCAALSSVKLGRQFHGHAFKNNYSSDVIVGTAIMDMYAKGDSLDDARRVFQWLPTRSLQSWNAIIVGFVRNDQGHEAIELFKLMNHSGVGFDEISLSAVPSACAEVKGYLQGLQVHCLALKSGVISDVCVANAVLDMYGKCKALEEACDIFKEMDWRDSVSWNAVITAFEQNGQYEETLLHFHQMLHCGLEPDEFTYGSVLKACAGLQSLDCGVKVHNKMIKSGLSLDSFVGSALVDMYCKCGMMGEAQKLHDRIDKQTLVSANAIISGFSLQKQSEEAQSFFSQMLDNGLEPDNFTYATVLDTCADLATIELGKQIHAQIMKLDLDKDVFISSTLVDMYAKCGNMNDSLLTFEKMLNRDLVSWNAMICGYAYHGLGLDALRMFERMQLEKVRPNHTTFVAVLRACGHVGLFDEGMSYFHLMTNHYELEPQLEHYSCMVDIVGRSKGIIEALELIDKMPFEADAVIWRTLLSVCKIQGNVEVAEVAANSLLVLDPEDSSSFVLLSNIYADAGRWGEVSKMRRLMRQSKLKKEPGCSWIEIKNELHTFLVGDKAHPRCSEIYERLDELVAEMKWVECPPNLDSFIEDEEDDLQEHLAMGNG